MKITRAASQRAVQLLWASTRAEVSQKVYQRQSTWKQSPKPLAVGAICLAACVVGGCSNTTLCEDGSKGSAPPNPLSTGGLSDKDIDELVESILNDPAINIASLPDYIERQIYRSTIRLFLASVYDALGSMHGMELLGHHVVLNRSKIMNHKEQFMKNVRGDLDEEILEQVVDRLLESKAINQAFIPDAIERKLYINCLKLIFRLMDLLAASFRLTVCGHVFGFSVERGTKENLAMRAIAASSLTAIDLERLKEYARESGVEDVHPTELTWWQRLFEKPQQDLIASVHLSLYALVLGIIDDLFANTSLELLSDKIEFDIASFDDHGGVEAVSVPAESSEDVKIRELTTPQIQQGGPRWSLFVAGLGVGATLASLLVR